MKTVKKRSQLQEKSVAKMIDGNTVIASGAMWHMKADVRNDKFLVECKTTSKKFYSVTTKVWEKIEAEAFKDNLRIPLLVVDLEDKERYVVFKPSYFETQLNQYGMRSETKNTSFRLCSEDFTEDTYYAMLYCITPIKAKVIRHLLMALPVDKFFDTFGEEIRRNE